MFSSPCFSFPDGLNDAGWGTANSSPASDTSELFSYADSLPSSSFDSNSDSGYSDIKSSSPLCFNIDDFEYFNLGNNSLVAYLFDFTFTP